MEKQGDIELPSYRGDIINDIAFTPQVAHARSACGCSAPIASPPRRSTCSALSRKAAYADLERVHQWTMGFLKDSPAGERYQELADRISESLLSCAPAA